MARLAIQVSRLLAERAGPELVSTPGWDMLVDLYVGDPTTPMSLTGLSGAASTPSRTSLSVIARLADHGMLIRTPDPNDGRRVLVHLSDKAIALLDSCFDALLLMML
ncbi:MarR family winged helix-turn-helix transcriptional regulator [Sphingomonas sp. MMS12-HWE2-04]|uniref:MarR family winged helix-turn-helix transcriptional regulator n=1 Tax=Sphingomonas sp. MMS12-HWE2-04 TaxID=3234199 RepID=UPI00384D3D16